MPDLDQRLGAARAELLDQIKGPELAEIRARAGALRRRRHGLVAASAAVALLAVVGTGVAVLGDGTADPDRGHLGASAPVNYQGRGLSMVPLLHDVLKLPGDLQDVEFVDGSRGYALAADCRGTGDSRCEVALATTGDGGDRWTAVPLPVRAMAAPPSLLTLGAGNLLLAAETGGQAWLSRDGGQRWQPSNPSATLPEATRVPENARLWLHGGGGFGGVGRSPTAGAGCVGRAVEVWSPDGTLARLANQPVNMNVCWVSAVPASDGAWWVGGTVLSAGARTPAVAVFRDETRTWDVRPLPPVPGVADAWAQVSVLGLYTFATVVSPPLGGQPSESLRVHAIYRSTTRGGAFAPYGDGPGLGTIVGDLVPLLDGRLVATSPGWMVSSRDGTAFTPTQGTDTLLWAGELRRTGAGWIAYDLARVGYAAWSRDGVQWRKIHVVGSRG